MRESAYPVLIVTALEQGGVAPQAGLKTGDLILQIDNTTVRNLTELAVVMEKISEGDIVDFLIMRITVGVFGQVQQRFSVQMKAQLKQPRRHIF